MLSVYQEFETVIAKLEQAQIPYALCGGLAVGMHTEPRATKDIDIQRLLYKNQPLWVVSREWLIWMKMLRSSPQDLVDIENLKKIP